MWSFLSKPDQDLKSEIINAEQRTHTLLRLQGQKGKQQHPPVSYEVDHEQGKVLRA